MHIGWTFFLASGGLNSSTLAREGGFPRNDRWLDSGNSTVRWPQPDHHRPQAASAALVKNYATLADELGQTRHRAYM